MGCPGPGGGGLAGSISSASMRSIHQKDEPIMPNAHKAILTLLLDWSKEVPFDLKCDPCFKQELNDLLTRISLLGEQYQWKAEEIRMNHDLQVRNILVYLGCSINLRGVRFTFFFIPSRHVYTVCSKHIISIKVIPKTIESEREKEKEKVW